MQKQYNFYLIQCNHYTEVGEHARQISNGGLVFTTYASFKEWVTRDYIRPDGLKYKAVHGESLWVRDCVNIKRTAYKATSKFDLQHVVIVIPWNEVITESINWLTDVS